ncbi:arginyltransferase ASCRUDRAFT_71034 [Ascoidea rubescens DSM 1968]|uniref:arginyltransferase n=1 Tax=Ascoidea rubescens DSM 1968 TaxID=1344418 RepID=A0A1D2VFY7_9ASCO|nr:hypothetical protein ASCRUDRAFT_71034 [Ascoidea rubescens DSM 1968]ODV60546.1 hypothetical protein ASCRUDRAFT_71034 [Ascoidea rubescens DSM 1968]
MSASITNSNPSDQHVPNRSVFNKLDDSIYYPLLDLDYQNRFIIFKPAYIKNISCGYCKLSKNSNQVFLQIYSIDIKTYEILINKNYRRSGIYLYKFDLLRNCCNLYTIRSNSSFLKLSNDLKKSLKRFIHFFNPSFNIFPIDKSLPSSFYNLLLKFWNHQRTKIKSVFTSPNFTPEKYNLFKKYQIAIHKDKPSSLSEKSFTEFLCDSPFNINYDSPFYLQQLDILNNSWYKFDSNQIPDLKTKQPFSKILGLLHECYYYNDTLIAISFIDVLINGISSVYFIYDPDYKKLSFGNISAIKDFLLCDLLNKDYYYLGYYISNCPKMNYKKKFGGELLNMINYRYYPISLFENNSRLLNNYQSNSLLENFVCLSDQNDLSKLQNFENNNDKIIRKTINEKSQSHFEFNLDISRSQSLELNPCSYSVENNSKDKTLLNVSDLLYNSFTNKGTAFTDLKSIVSTFKNDHSLTLTINSSELKTIYNPKFINSVKKTGDIDISNKVEDKKVDDDDNDDDHEDNDNDNDIDLGAFQLHNRNNTYKRLPLIIPGLIPLSQINTLIKNGKLDNLTVKMSCYSLWLRFDQVKFSDIPEKYEPLKFILIDLVRLFGLDIVNCISLFL